MKQIIQKLWIVIAMLYLSISASAYDFEVDGIHYDITSFTDLTVTASSLSESIEGMITIPSLVEFSGKSLTVTAVGDKFIEGNLKITSVAISEGVKEIGSFAFSNCTNINDIGISESVRLIQSNAFYNCSGIRNLTADGVTTIGDHCFEGCTEIEKVSFATLSSIPSYAFSRCSKLNHAEFPSVQSIGSNAFNSCAFSSFDVSSSVTEIKAYAFSNCKQLESFIIPNNVRNIETGLFAGCSSLRNVVIGSGITSLPWIFGNCTSLENIRIEDSYSTLTFEYCGSRNFSDGTTGHPINYTSSDYSPVASMFANINLKEVYIGRNITTEAFAYKSVYMSGSYDGRYYYYIPNPPFSSSGISKLELGPLVTDFKMCQSKTSGYREYVHGSWDGAFQNCTNLIETKLLSTASTISNNSFAGCSSLKVITVPNVVMSIGAGAFQNCKSLESIDLGCYLTSLGNNVFSGDLALSSINIRSANPPTYPTGFSSSEYINTAVNIPSGSLEKYKEAEPWKNFWNLTESDDLISLFEVDEIKYLVLSENFVQVVGQTISSSRKVLIPSTVSYSGVQFNVSSIGDNAFKNCIQIEELEIEDGIVTIGNNAFEGCKNIKTIDLPTSINALGNGAFKNCSKLGSFNMSSPIEVIPFECFYGCYSLSEFSFDRVTTIGASSFYDCDALSKIVITPSVINIGPNAFSACSNIKEFIIEDSNQIINFPAGLYDGATSIQKKEVNGKTIQFKIQYYNAFFNGLPIEKLYIGRNLSDSPRYTITGDGGVDYYLITSYDAPFNNLPKLQELTIGEYVDVLGPNEKFIPEVEMYDTPGSFKKCSSLKKVNVKNTIPPTGVEFSNTAYSKAMLVVPDNTISLYEVAEGWKEFLTILDETSAGIDEICTDERDKNILVNNEGIIYVGNTIEDVYVYGIDGRLIHSIVASPNQPIVMSNGLYIIRIKNKSFIVKI